MGSLEFALRFVSKLLCSCLCLFDVFVNSHAMDEKCSLEMTFSLESESEFICNKGLFES